MHRSTYFIYMRLSAALWWRRPVERTVLFASVEWRSTGEPCQITIAPALTV